jgi:DNA-binding MarR family transcriptional regulator
MVLCQRRGGVLDRATSRFPRALHRHSQGGGCVMTASRSPRLRFTLRQLEYLVAVGEAGTIAEAAHRLNVSSPSISAAISQLEAEFGVQLFVRNLPTACH